MKLLFKTAGESTYQHVLKATFATSLGLVLGFCAEPLQARPLGIDVSSYQGSGINWTSVKNSGRSFAWAKATEGSTITDADFTINESHGKSAGVIMGAYHFAHAESDSAASEANYFWGVAGGYIKADAKTFMPMLDMEVFSGHVNATSYSDWANQWCGSITSKARSAGVDITPFIYVSSCNACNFDSSVAQWSADLANYNGEDPQTGNPWNTCTGCEAWGSGAWDVWQYSSSGSVSGVSGGVDVDVINGSSTSPYVATADGTVGSVSNPTVINHTDGTLELFAIGADTSVDHTWQTQVNGGWYNGWPTLGGSAIKKTIVGINANGNLQNFVIAGDNTIYSTYWDSVNLRWSGYFQMGTSTFNDICVATNTDGRMELFGINTSGVLMHKYQTAPNGSWSAWYSIGGSGGTRVEASNNEDGSLAVFFLGSGGTLYQTFINTSGGWNPPTSLGGVCSDISVVTWPTGDQHIEVFGIGSGGGVFHKWQLGSNGANGWSAWYSMGGAGYTRIKSAINSLNVPEVFMLTGGGQTDHFFLNGSSWDGPFSLGGTHENITIGANANGTLTIFGVGTDGQMYHKWYIGGSTGWSGWFSLGGNLAK